jgi:hypothetical protein
MLGQCNHFEVIGSELAADDELQRQFLRGHMCSHDSGHGTLVGQREARITELGRGSHELLWM